MPVDIDKLTHSELIDLNNRVVARLNFLQQMRAHASMLEFSIGERVSFHPDGHDVLYGIIAKHKRKSVTVITETGQRWTVAPGLPSSAVSAPTAAQVNGQAISLKRK